MMRPARSSTYVLLGIGVLFGAVLGCYHGALERSEYQGMTGDSLNSLEAVNEYSCRENLPAPSDTGPAEHHWPEAHCDDLGYNIDLGRGKFHASEDGYEPGACGFWGDGSADCANGGGLGDGGDGGSDCGSYNGPTADAQRDSFCQAAWSAQCAGEDSSAYCDTYNESSWGSSGNCPYC